MKRTFLLFFLLFIVVNVFAQKKPLDHSVYDNWQSIGERTVSNDGKWVAYTINVQEGDNELVIQSSTNDHKQTFPRGYGATITDDSRFVIFKIRPPFKETREARIKKKRPDDMPKDSLAILELGKNEVVKIARVKTFKAPEKQSGWVAYHLEKPIAKTESNRPARPESSDKKIADSLNRVIDSLKQIIASLPEKKKRNKDEQDLFEAISEQLDAEGDEPTPSSIDSGTDLVIRNLLTGKDKTLNNVLEYSFSKKGNKLVLEQAKNPKDSLSKNSVILYDLENDKPKILSKGGNEFKNFSFSDDGRQLAFLAERDSKPKDLQKFYKLWYYEPGMDSAVALVDKAREGMKLGMTVSEFGNLSFSKSGKKLFFGTAPIQPPKDTTLIDIDLVKVDVWHYNDDYLQTQQLFRLQRDLQTNYLAVIDIPSKTIVQLASPELPQVYTSNEGDGDRYIGITDFGKRVESQWAGSTRRDIYVIDGLTGGKKMIRKDMLGILTPQYISPTGKYITWYDSKAKNYFAWDGDSVRNITRKIKVKLWDEDHDSPSDPPPYGLMRWDESDNLLIYDRYGIWRVDPTAKKNPELILDTRKNKKQFRYIQIDPEERFIKKDQKLLFRTFNESTKQAGIWEAHYASNLNASQIKALQADADFSFSPVTASKDGNTYLYTRESYSHSPDLFVYTKANNEDWKGAVLSTSNPQQKDYNWGTAELYKWKAFDGKMAEGVIYKPEDFDPSKKYPVIFYFYETHSNTLHDYIDPAPTGSRINVPFFVSRGYIVFSPDIHYTIGHPAKSAYNYVVSAAQDLAKKKWIDAKNMGLQGQSWGGIQVAQLITMTDMFKAAWAGAPVANMTSAYGGIRWESGANRQFQYEKTQSRIGATLWEKPQLYIENSPLFHLPKVKTPLVIMANDADGAVPWYQGIELFTGMRRLGKKVWMLNYNGEAHNLVERKNKKDIQIREQQYFDWLLKGAKPPRWITDGVPAVKKGKDWGLELVD